MNPYYSQKNRRTLFVVAFPFMSSFVMPSLCLLLISSRALKGLNPSCEGRELMSGVLLFANVDPRCATGEGLIPVEVEAGAAVADIIAELKRLGAVHRGVEVEWQGRRLAPGDLLADVGLGSQSTVCVMPSTVPAPHHRIAAGMYDSIAILRGGEVTSWGDDGDMRPQLPAPAVSVCVSCHFSGSTTAYLLANGSIKVMCNTTNIRGGARDHVSQVPPLPCKAVDVAMGRDHCVALCENGEVICWGRNERGQCDPPPMSGVQQVAATNVRSLALLGDGTVRCWGGFLEGGGEESPILPGRAVQVDCGGLGFYAVLEDGRLARYTENSTGAVIVTIDTGPLTGVKQVACGVNHIVILLHDGTVMCHAMREGSNESNYDWGQLDVPELGAPAVEVSAGGEYSMALLE
eukprot:Hpha_TRINITY_DN15411_c4_g2::TRINITY_DN15411_c4_g2_i1::g.177153::m.177153